MIWLSTVWDSHSTQLQGPTGRFDGQFIKLKICFQPGVSSFDLLKCETNNELWIYKGETFLHEILDNHNNQRRRCEVLRWMKNIMRRYQAIKQALDA